jgi:Ca2+-binding RTX toxin-like protein
MDFDAGVAKVSGTGVLSTAATDIVVQYYWKTTDAGGTFTGGSLGDKLVGGAGTDTFDGAGGKDTITGGAGSDQITLGAGADTLVLNSLIGSDTILDFAIGADGIHLSKSAFTALGATGALTAAQFVSGAGVSAGADATDRIVYDTTDGKLYYDSDGNGTAAAVLLATFTGAPLLTVNHFTVIG